MAIADVANLDLDPASAEAELAAAQDLDTRCGTTEFEARTCRFDQFAYRDQAWSTLSARTGFHFYQAAANNRVAAIAVDVVS